MNASAPTPEGFVRRSFRRVRFVLTVFSLGMVAGVVGLLIAEHLIRMYVFSPSDVGRVTLVHENADLNHGQTVKVKKAFVIRQGDKKSFILTEGWIGAETMATLREGDAVVGYTYRKVIKVASDDAMAGVASKDNPLVPPVQDEITVQEGEKKALKDLKRKL